MAGIITQGVYRVHYYEVDYQGRILPTSLINYLQDITWIQSEEVGLGMKKLFAQNYRWVLYQWDIAIDQYPQYNENLLISTCPLAMDKFSAYRKFEVKSQNGQTLATAMSRWALVNGDTIGLARIPPEMAESFGLILGDTSEIPKLNKIKGPQEEHYTFDIVVRYSDIDTNRHVNNGKYIEWAMESIPFEKTSSRSLQGIEVIYKVQGEYGEKLKVVTEVKTDSDILWGEHKIVGAENKLKCLLRTKWT